MILFIGHGALFSLYAVNDGQTLSDFDSYTWTQGHSFRRLMLIIVAFLI